MKSFLKFIIFKIIDLLILENGKNKQNSLLLLRLDAIGDYILFRNFIEVLKQSDDYKGYEITLVGNIVWKNLAEYLDKDLIDKFIWIDTKKFHRNPIYRYKKLKEITNTGYEIVIHSTYSRTMDTDFIVKAISANEKIGSIGDLSNIKAWQKRISDKWYSKLLSAKDEIMFEFYRNKEFFENLLKKEIEIKKPTIKLKYKKLNIKLPEKYAVLFIGASSSFRKWDIRNFSRVGQLLKEKYGYDIVLCGGSTDIEDAKRFATICNYEYLDLVGKTSLVDLIYVIYNGNLMVSNETFAPHMAVALEMTNIFVISNGNHFGRFIPYPKEIWNHYYPIYHPEIEKDLDNYKKLSNRYGYGSKLNINEISVEKVIEKIEKVLKKGN